MTDRFLLIFSIPPMTQSTSTPTAGTFLLLLAAVIGSLDIRTRFTVYRVIGPLGSEGGCHIMVAVKGVIDDSGTSGG